MEKARLFSDFFIPPGFFPEFHTIRQNGAAGIPSRVKSVTSP